jgi:hypothetical protein
VCVSFFAFFLPNFQIFKIFLRPYLLEAQVIGAQEIVDVVHVVVLAEPLQDENRVEAGEDALGLLCGVRGGEASVGNIRNGTTASEIGMIMGRRIEDHRTFLISPGLLHQQKKDRVRDTTRHIQYDHPFPPNTTQPDPPSRPHL